MPSIKVETREVFKQRLIAKGRWYGVDGYLSQRMKLKAAIDPTTGKPFSDLTIRHMLAKKFGMKQRDQHDKSKGSIEVPMAELMEANPSPEVLEEILKESKAIEKAMTSDPLTTEMFAGKVCDHRTAIQWVFDNMDITDITYLDAPSSGAWSMLMQCRKSGQFKGNFYNNIYPKTMPTKSDFERQDQFTDDGRDAFEMIERIRAESKPVEDQDDVDE